MKTLLHRRAVFIFLFTFSSIAYSQPKHFVFIGMDRDQLKDTSIWTSPVFDGVQIAYSWRQIEHNKDAYDFEMIDEDIALLKKYNKKLFIQLQDVSFSLRWNHTPKYILEDPVYNGGANLQYQFKDNNEKEYTELGWVSRRWDPSVQERLHRLYMKLGNKYDGVVEGINTEETAIDFGSGPLHPPGFSFSRYNEAIRENIGALKRAFPRSVVIVYANFMPGGWLPSKDSSLFKSVYQYAWQNNIGVGGPDLFPYKPGQMNNSYGFIRDSYNKVPAGVAVQDGNYNYINPKTGEKIKTEEIYRFATEYLHLSYIFWGTEQPYFSSQTIPFLRSLKSK